MKEITAIIRRDKMSETKTLLDEMGYPSLSYQSVDGRGKQKGDGCGEIDPEMPDSFCTAVKLKPTPSTYALDHSLPKVALFVPKRLLTMIVPDEAVNVVVESLIRANNSGRHGDGKVFISPVDKALRIRTGEMDCEAVK